jgi:hypothetical protein
LARKSLKPLASKEPEQGGRDAPRLRRYVASLDLNRGGEMYRTQCADHIHDVMRFLIV